MTFFSHRLLFFVFLAFLRQLFNLNKFTPIHSGWGPKCIYWKEIIVLGMWQKQKKYDWTQVSMGWVIDRKKYILGVNYSFKVWERSGWHNGWVGQREIASNVQSVLLRLVYRYITQFVINDSAPSTYTGVQSPFVHHEWWLYSSPLNAWWNPQTSMQPLLGDT